MSRNHAGTNFSDLPGIKDMRRQAPVAGEDVSESNEVVVLNRSGAKNAAAAARINELLREYRTLKILQLRYLLAIADNGMNITAAAGQLYTSQPGVSKQLKLLEEELGVRLFNRHGKSLTGLTAAGRGIIVHARRIMQEVEEIHGLCRKLNEGAREQVDLSSDT